jgi:hypothetical protein
MVSRYSWPHARRKQPETLRLRIRIDDESVIAGNELRLKGGGLTMDVGFRMSRLNHGGGGRGRNHHAKRVPTEISNLRLALKNPQ